MENTSLVRELVAPTIGNKTTHMLQHGDARDLSWISDLSVHLVVTSPPYWTLKKYNENANQLGSVEDYEQFLCELDPTFRKSGNAKSPIFCGRYPDGSHTNPRSTGTPSASKILR